MTVKRIFTDLMVEHPKIQRDLKPARVNKIAKEFDSRYLSVFHVVVSDGKYLVIDGQHRLAAIKKLQAAGKLGPTQVDCIIVPFEIAGDDAALKQYFNKVNEGYKLSQQDKFTVDEKSGDELTVRAREAADEFGYSLTSRKTIDRSLSYGAWKEAFAENEDKARQALDVLSKAYTPFGNFTMAVFSSVFAFINSSTEPVDLVRLQAALTRVGSDELNSKSRGHKRTINGRKAVEEAYREEI